MNIVVLSDWRKDAKRKGSYSVVVTGEGDEMRFSIRDAERVPKNRATVARELEAIANRLRVGR